MPDNFKESKKYFPTALQEFQFYDKYSRFDWEKGRRETWVETVDRVIDHIKWLSQNKLDDSEYDELKKGLLEMKATPSMRMLAMAGKAAQRDGTTIFNCSYIPIDSIDAWIEALIISMCGCGVGYSVEKEHVDKLPDIKKQNGKKHSYVVQDSMTGWADALRYGLEKWFNGEDVEFDYSLLRPAGAPLKTKGGHSSGPKVLQETLDFIRDRILNKQDGKLSTLDAHDIMCKVGDASISGGVRRCIKAGTLVNLNRGMVPIEDVKVGDEVLTDDGYKKVLDHVYQGRQGLVEIKTETGAKLYVTPDHRMAVLSDVKGGYEFKQAQNLFGEDRLIFINQSIIGTNQELKKLDDFREADQVRTDIKQPELTIETAWILGKFLADGYVYITEYDENGKGGNCHVEFACHTKEVKQIERIKKWFESIGIEAKVAEGEGNWVKVRSCNRRIARWFGNYKEPNKTIKVPEEIFKSPTNIRWSFLAGLGDGDGSFTARPFVEVSTIYEDFGRDVVKLLSSLGIISEIRRHREEIGNWKPLWTVSVKDSRSLDVVRSNFSEFSTKPPIPYRKVKQAGYTIPNKFVRRDLKNIQYKNKYSVSGGRGMNHHTCSEITGADNFTPVKVVSVSYHGEDETYDLTVDGNHVFVAEGYLTHNTAMISLFDGDDQEMLTAKDGDFYLDNPQRFNANNSSVWPDREMTKEEIRKFMYKMDESKRGEPGIFSRRNANLLKPDRRKAHQFGTNPCGEINLRPMQFCNLSIAVARADDTEETLKKKVELATIFGTIQAMESNYPGLRPDWAKNNEEERLLGVDITGFMDCPLLQENNGVLSRLKDHAVATNVKYAAKLGINRAAAVTCNKPSGNSSTLFDCSSGIHARYAKYYIRRVRINATSPTRYVMEECGMKLIPDRGKSYDEAEMFVAEFPVKAPEGSKVRDDLSAKDQFMIWLKNKKEWTEHNPSFTLYYKEEELDGLIDLIYENQDYIGGISFLPHSDAQYDLMPYEEIDAETYEKMLLEAPTIDWSLLPKYEQTDLTEAAQLLACVGGACDI